MAKNVKKTSKTTSKARSTSCVVKSAKSGRFVKKDSSSGVVAYTKDSRFKDTEVQVVVQRVLKKS